MSSSRLAARALAGIVGLCSARLISWGLGQVILLCTGLLVFFMLPPSWRDFLLMKRDKAVLFIYLESDPLQLGYFAMHFYPPRKERRSQESTQRAHAFHSWCSSNRLEGHVSFSQPLLNNTLLGMMAPQRKVQKQTYTFTSIKKARFYEYAN